MSLLLLGFSEDSILEQVDINDQIYLYQRNTTNTYLPSWDCGNYEISNYLIIGVIFVLKT